MSPPNVLLAMWLKSHRFSLRTFGDEVGCSGSFVALLVHGRSRPGLELAVRIEQLTGGTVPAKAWSKTNGKRAAARPRTRTRRRRR